MTMPQSMHPSPQRARVGLLPLLVGLAGPPAAWSVQLIVDYGLSSYSCYPSGVPRAQVLPGWNGIWGFVLAINLLALVTAAATAFLSYRNWFVTKNEHPGEADDLVEVGEGRSRFVGLAGALAGLGFIIAILLDLVAILGTPQCSG